MLSREQAADIFNRIRKHSTADEVEAYFYGGHSALTRFANNVIHQNVADENYGVSVRTSFGGRTARASTNKLDENSLKRVVEASESLARVQHPDPDLLPMPTPEERDAVNSPRAAMPSRHFAETAAITPERRASVVGQIVAIANRHHLSTAGIYSSSQSVEGIFNSRGLSDWHTQTSAEVSITMLAGDSSGWQKANSPNVRDLDALALAETAARKATTSAAPRELPAGKYTVILEPAAVLDIVGFMFWDFSGQAILDQRSFLNQRVGTQLFGENINIWDDACSPFAVGCSIRWRRDATSASASGGEGSREGGRLCARHCREDEEVGIRVASGSDCAHGPWLPVAERNGRDARQHRIRKFSDIRRRSIR